MNRREAIQASAAALVGAALPSMPVCECCEPKLPEDLTVTYGPTDWTIPAGTLMYVTFPDGLLSCEVDGREFQGEVLRNDGGELLVGNFRPVG